VVRPEHHHSYLPQPPMVRWRNGGRINELCFNCHERFYRNHRCKACFLVLIVDEEEESELGNKDGL
jgi:hypothetical protein